MFVSGRYEWSDSEGVPFTKEVLHFDVDGGTPQMAASVTGTAGLQTRAHWIAQPLTAVVKQRKTEWGGPIIYKYGDTQLVPYEKVKFQLMDGKLQATFSGSGQPTAIRDYTFQSESFRQVALEYDAEEGTELVLDYETHSHPDRPSNLPSETLSVDMVFERTGFRVIRTGEDGIVPNDGDGENGKWTNAELHDAMQCHFSRIAKSSDKDLVDCERWALWVFFAKMHEKGFNLGGAMFDRIGDAHRQGTALFLDSFISKAPRKDAAPSAWKRRMVFWTAIHEMGHAFNLLHSWEKRLGTPWIPQRKSFSHQSFMNYPYFYKTGKWGNHASNTIKFFQDFAFRFTDEELFFIRHAPEQFVIMGGADFGTNHALEQANVSPAPELQLEMRVNREKPIFEFLEPIVIELKLTNISSQPKIIDRDILGKTEEMTILVQKRDRSQKVFRPYAQFCIQPNLMVLFPGNSLYESIFISVGSDGWLIDEPGYYRIQVCIHEQNEDIVSNPLLVRVMTPRSWDEEYLAQDYFSDEVGRTLTFDGTFALEIANDTLNEVTEKLASSKVAIHANVALTNPRIREFKRIETSDETRSRYKIIKTEPDQEMAVKAAKNLGETPENAEAAADALGHINYRYYTEQCASSLRQLGVTNQAKQLHLTMYNTLQKRGIVQDILDEIALTLNTDNE